MAFDYAYWGIYKNSLEKGEEIIQKLASQYELSDDDLCNIEETAKLEAATNISANGLNNLSNIINERKIITALALICQKQNLDIDNFDYTVNGNVIEIIYKEERVA